ncbi:NACHT domain-containing protein [Dongia mobilis]|uniref:NACHT domain-containing protein n=1 Tax=Dongia mobilis TaxID=578943 RepID=A0A4R6WSX0_9PROT|nr:NACHT domain-containing protein [Dongia mobilis]TDQ82164.1 NACHT domain-containing protein [Dongia mobilis]
MNLSLEQLTDELGVFSDMGTSSPKVSDGPNYISFEIVRNGQRQLIKFDKKSSIVTLRTENEAERKHASYRALLASATFANLREWAGTQRRVLMQTIKDIEELIPIEGNLSNLSIESTGTAKELMNGYLESNEHGSPGVRVLLIDGPAGIGKTRLIESVALNRAQNFAKQQKPLILHVKSRGRVLTYLQDLIAFSLQTIRAQVTYDQVPILVRHGLIQLAIDGFDELGDPNGYDTAWAQVRDLVQEIEGQGALILAGRETFIGRERLLKAVPRLSQKGHNVAVLSLVAVQPATAKKWLRSKGWSEQQFSGADYWGLFEEGSYALRPFFLNRLEEIYSDHADFVSNPPLIMLVNRMIEREAEKFGDQVAATFGEHQRRTIVASILSEVARDISENQSDSIDEEALVWIVDAVLGDEADPTVANLLKNRVLALAFLQNDDRKGRRSFAHSEFFNFFLSTSAIDALSKGEIPKFLRRNIIGADFLVTFGLVLESKNADQIRDFLVSASELLHASPLDRSSRNIGALMISAIPISDGVPNFAIKNVDVDDAVIRGKGQKSSLINVTINQLDIREADIAQVVFESVQIGVLISDATTRVSATFPNVSWIETLQIDGKELTLLDSDALDWLDSHGRVESSGLKENLVLDQLRTSPLYNLLQKVCRTMLRQHWIRSEGDDRATLLVDDERWEELVQLLARHDLLVVDTSKQVGGRPSKFFHVRQARSILAEEMENQKVRGLLDDVVAASTHH